MYVLKLKTYGFHAGFYQVPANDVVRDFKDGYIELSLKTELPLCAFLINYEEEDEPRVFFIKEALNDQKETIGEININKNFPINKSFRIARLIFAL